MGYKILVIDDEPQFINSITSFFELENHSVISATHPQEGLNLLEKENPEVILLDVKLPGQSTGVDLIQKIRAINENVPIIMVSGFIKPDLIVRSIKAGAADYLQKPFDCNALLYKMRTALDEQAKEQGLSSSLNFTQNSIARIEYKTLVKALEECGGNISKTAKKLNLSRDTIYRRIKKYNILIKKNSLN